MRKNRDRLSIVAAVLKAAADGANKTGIMYGANLSYKLLEKYLETTLSAGFVQVESSGYGLTDRGRDFLSRYRRFKNKHFKVQEKLEDLAEERTVLEKLCWKGRSDLEVGLVKGE